MGSCVCFFTTKQKYRNFYLPQHSRRLLDMSMGRFTFLSAIFLFSLHRPFPLSSSFPLFLLTILHFLPLFPFSRPLFFLSFPSLFSSPPPSLLFLPPQMQLGGLWERRKFPDTKTKRFCYLHIGPLLCPSPRGHFGIVRSVRLSVPWRSCLGYRHADCLQLSHRRSPEMCGLWTRPRTDVEPPRFLDP